MTLAEVERLRRVAKVRDIDGQTSDMPYSIARIDQTRMVIEP